MPSTSMCITEQAPVIRYVADNFDDNICFIYSNCKNSNRLQRYKNSKKDRRQKRQKRRFGGDFCAKKLLFNRFSGKKWVEMMTKMGVLQIRLIPNSYLTQAFGTDFANFG